MKNDVLIFSVQILEAITTSRCNESFSLERLELMGDSVLKYFISGHLFCKHPKKHEGQLTSLRTLEICNSKLHKVGTDKNLQVCCNHFIIHLMFFFHLLFNVIDKTDIYKRLSI